MAEDAVMTSAQMEAEFRLLDHCERHAEKRRDRALVFAIWAHRDADVAVEQLVREARQVEAYLTGDG